METNTKTNNLLESYVMLKALKEKAKHNNAQVIQKSLEYKTKLAEVIKLLQQAKFNFSETQYNCVAGLRILSLADKGRVLILEANNKLQELAKEFQLKETLQNN